MKDGKNVHVNASDNNCHPKTGYVSNKENLLNDFEDMPALKVRQHKSNSSVDNTSVGTTKSLDISDVGKINNDESDISDCDSTFDDLPDLFPHSDSDEELDEPRATRTGIMFCHSMTLILKSLLHQLFC